MAAWDAVKEAKHPRIHVFLATSVIHEELAMAIRTRADFYDAETGINTRKIHRSSKLLSNITGVFVRFKDLADKKKDITGSDIEALVLNRRGVSQGDCRLVIHVVNTGHGVPNISCIKLQRGNEELEDVAIGSGPPGCFLQGHQPDAAHGRSAGQLQP